MSLNYIVDGCKTGGLCTQTNYGGWLRGQRTDGTNTLDSFLGVFVQSVHIAFLEM
jgi:hypothetical protein